MAGSKASQRNRMLYSIDAQTKVHGRAPIMPKDEVNAYGWHKSLVPTTGTKLGIEEKAKGMSTWKVVIIVIVVLCAYTFALKKKWI